MQYTVTYTSMLIDARDEDEAIERAQESSGGSWETTPADDSNIREED